MVNIRNNFYKHLFLFIFLFFNGQFGYAENIGVIAQLSGDVWLMEGGKAWRLTQGDTVASQHTIITEQDSLARVELHDGTILSIGPRTRMKLEAYKKKEKESFSFDVLWGDVKYMVKKIIDSDTAFNVKTTTAAIGVRGTIFTVSMPHPDHINGLRFSPSASLSSIDLQTTTVDMEEGHAVLTDLKGRAHPLPAGTITTVDKDAHVVQVVKGAPILPEPTPPPPPAPVPRVDAQSTGSKAAVTTGANTSAIQGITSFGGR